MIACGGTGGHLSPGIALAEELVSRGWKCELIISNKQVDSRLVNKYSDFDYFSVPGSPLSLNPVRFA
ncbi:MAG: glycosyltransferase, partial [Verrucomicrobiota bacterium]